MVKRTLGRALGPVKEPGAERRRLRALCGPSHEGCGHLHDSVATAAVLADRARAFPLETAANRGVFARAVRAPPPMVRRVLDESPSLFAEEPGMDVSVVIPTYNRARTMARERARLGGDREARAAARKGMIDRVRHLAWYHSDRGRRLAAARAYLAGFLVIADPGLLARAAAVLVPRPGRTP